MLGWPCWRTLSILLETLQIYRTASDLGVPRICLTTLYASTKSMEVSWSTLLALTSLAKFMIWRVYAWVKLLGNSYFFSKRSYSVTSYGLTLNELLVHPFIPSNSMT
jgi:hypothetical protein